VTQGILSVPKNCNIHLKTKHYNVSYSLSQVFRNNNNNINNNNNNNNYYYTRSNWSHWNINEKLKDKFGSCTRKTLNRFTTNDGYTWNITHNTESTAV